MAALTQHSSVMTEIYRELNKLTVAGINDDAAYAQLFQSAVSYSDWYAARKRVANSMKAAAAKQRASSKP